ncbi:MAG: hypothetical protein AAFN59_09540 [Pseudomonadota bacterium]
MADHAPGGHRIGMAAHIATVIGDGGKISGQNGDVIRETLLLAASLPDQDYDGFCAATALILADGLHGGGDDNLYWHWDAFQAHYALAARPVRAALLQGYLTGAGIGRFSIDQLPPRSVATSDPEHMILTSLRTMLQTAAPDDKVRDMASAIVATLAGEQSVAHCANFWKEAAAPLLESNDARADVAVRGMRFLYELHAEFDPGFEAMLFPELAQNRRDTARHA